MLKSIYLSIFVSLLSGCASVVISPHDAVIVEKQFILEKGESPNPSAATAVFTRDQGGPPGSRWLIYIDGKAVVQLARGEKYLIRLEPGDHIFGIEPDARIKVLQIMNIAQSLSPNKTYYFRAMYTGEEYRIQPSMGDADIR